MPEFNSFDDNGDVIMCCCFIAIEGLHLEQTHTLRSTQTDRQTDRQTDVKYTYTVYIQLLRTETSSKDSEVDLLVE